MHECFKNSIPQLLLFVDFGCGPMTAGLGLAGILSKQKEDYKINTAYLGVDLSINMVNKARAINEKYRLFAPEYFKVVQSARFASQPTQQIVNEYQPGQGIAPHTDRTGFGPVVASLSLGSDCMMNIIPHRKGKQDAFDIVLKRCSLLGLQQDSHHVWIHGIALRRSDKQGDPYDTAWLAYIADFSYC